MTHCEHKKDKYIVKNSGEEYILVKCIFCGWRTWLLVKK